MTGEIRQEILDAVRPLVLYTKDAGYGNLGTLRLYAKRNETIVLPDWMGKLPDSERLTKGDISEVFYRTFKKAEEAL